MKKSSLHSLITVTASLFGVLVAVTANPLSLGPNGTQRELFIDGHMIEKLTGDVRQQLQLPDFFSEMDWITSPLSRAIETGKLLGITEMLIDDRLIETNWGDWEGQVLQDLRIKYGQEMLENEKKGLDLSPPGGESPRQVCQRLQPLLSDIATSGKQKLIGAITHKGVIRSLLSLATGCLLYTSPSPRD